jgi:hypothetical protein
VAVDASVGGKDYRLVTTHLEVQRPDPTNPLSQIFQSAQAGELLEILLNTTPPDRSLIVADDMNSSPVHQAVPGPLPPPFNAGIPTPRTSSSSRSVLRTSGNCAPVTCPAIRAARRRTYPIASRRSTSASI